MSDTLSHEQSKQQEVGEPEIRRVNWERPADYSDPNQSNHVAQASGMYEFEIIGGKIIRFRDVRINSKEVEGNWVNFEDLAENSLREMRRRELQRIAGVPEDPIQD